MMNDADTRDTDHDAPVCYGRRCVVDAPHRWDRLLRHPYAVDTGADS